MICIDFYIFLHIFTISIHDIHMFYGQNFPDVFFFVVNKVPPNGQASFAPGGTLAPRGLRGAHGAGDEFLRRQRGAGTHVADKLRLHVGLFLFATWQKQLKNREQKGT